MYKYVLSESKYGLDVYPAKGKIELNESISQANLLYLYDLGFEGVTRVEIPKEKKSTKKGDK